MPYKTLTCRTCGSEFEGWHNAKYCSNACRERRFEHVCDYCGEEFTAKRGQSYCSPECASYGRHEGETKRVCDGCGESFNGGYNQQYCDGCTTATCEECAEEYTVKPSHFCSAECRVEADRTKFEKHCEHCGDLFTTQPSDVENGWGKYCSRECTDAAKKARNHTTTVCESCGETFDHLKSDGNRKYCSNECRLEGQATTFEVRECGWCGERFEVPDYSSTEYCSVACSKRKLEEKDCPTCGDTFQPTREGEKFCSHECYSESRTYERNEDGERQCPGCDKWLPSEAFYRDDSRPCGRHSHCIDCMARSNEHRQEVIEQGEDLAPQIHDMMIEQEAECVYCGESISNNFHLDHKTPISRGGEHTRENTHLTCPDCNHQKHHRTHAEYVNWRRDNDLHIPPSSTSK